MSPVRLEVPPSLRLSGGTGRPYTPEAEPRLGLSPVARLLRRLLRELLEPLDWSATIWGENLT